MHDLLSQAYVWVPVAIFAISGAMSSAAAWLPPAVTSNPTYNTIRKVIDFLAQNFRNAKNAK